MTHGTSLTVQEPLGAESGSSADHPLFVAAANSLQAAYPEAPIGPFFLSHTVTDARYFREYGIPTYGYSPFLFLSTDTIRVDRINERVSLPGFVAGLSSWVWLRGGDVLGTFHGFVGVLVATLFFAAAVLGRRIEKGRSKAFDAHALLGGLALLLAALAAVAGFALLP